MLNHTVVDYEPLVMSQSALMPHLNIDQLFFPPLQTASFLSLHEHVERPTKSVLAESQKRFAGGCEHRRFIEGCFFGADELIKQACLTIEE